MKLKKNKLAVTVIVLSVTFLGIILYTINNENKGDISSGLGSTINPLQKVVYTISDKIKGSLDFLLNFSNVKEENKQLTEENIELKNNLIEYEKLKEENERLREVLNFKNSKNNYNYVGTEIIGYSGESYSDGYIIDKGENDGLKKDMVVIREGFMQYLDTKYPNDNVRQQLRDAKTVDDQVNFVKKYEFFLRI